MYVHSQQNLLKDPTEIWKFTVDTEATTAGEKTTGIPFNLYGQDNVILDVDWGDGTSSTLTSADYTSSDSRASVHEYASAGEYQVKIRSATWHKVRLLTIRSFTGTSVYNSTASLYWYKRTLLSVDNIFPHLLGSNQYYSDSSTSFSSNATFNYCFYKCSSLQSIPINLFVNIPHITSFVYGFCNCSSLQSIPAGLFDNNTKVTSFYECFYGCSSIQSIPTNLFDYNTLASDFTGCFSHCSSIQSIPAGLFDKNTSAVDFTGCFSYCQKINAIPTDLFRYNTSVNDFSGCFYYCSSITSIPVDLFRYNILATYFDSCFSDCVLLDAIPADLFRYNINAIGFGAVFKNCSLITNIPADLFKYNTQAIRFGYDTYLSGLTAAGGCFEGTGIESIPPNIFYYNTLVTKFYCCFANCLALKSVPEELFASNTLATDFSNVFEYCKSLINIPSKIFANNTLATNFRFCFDGCAFKSIPYNIFANNTNVKNFMWCFGNCLNLRQIKLIITSSSVTDVIAFFANNSSVNGIICTPLNSTTYTKFQSEFSSNNNITISTNSFDCIQTLEYTVDTDATTANAKTVTIPVQAVQNASSKLLIDWGDGNGVELLPSDVTTANLTYTYAEAGNYQITVGAANWLNYQFLADSNATSSNALIQTFRETVVSIDEPIPPVANTTLDYWFYNCTHLESYSSHIFDNLSNVTSAIGTFKNCSSLAVISAGTLRNQETLTSATEMFAGCVLPTYVPSGLLSQCRQLTNINSIFNGCTSLVTIPNTLLLNNTAITSQTNAFTGCANSSPTFLTKTQFETNRYYIELFDTEATNDGDDSVGIPFNLCGNINIALTVDWGDSNSSILNGSNYASESDSTASVHQYTNKGLYFVSMQSSNWTSTSLTSYTYSSKITAIYNPTAPFYWRQKTLIEVSTYIPRHASTLRKYYSSPSASNTLISESNSFNSFYRFCDKLKHIPLGLFDDNTTVTNFDYCFSNCSSLQSIPTGLFDSNTAVTSFQYCFENCYSLQSIPAGLFDNNTQVDVFTACFFNCSSLQSIPSGLFDSNTVATKFGSCFYGCSSLQSIPSGLFDNNTQVDVFTACFRGCSSLQSIPSGLFDKNTLVTYFNDCFYNCSSIQSIPTGLFDKNTLVTDFESCFSKCSSIQSIPSNLFINNTAATTFSYCFNNCSALTDFTLTIGSSSVSYCSSFVAKKTGATRTVYVPASSTTYTTFSNQASTLGLTIETIS